MYALKQKAKVETTKLVDITFEWKSSRNIQLHEDKQIQDAVEVIALIDAKVVNIFSASFGNVSQLKKIRNKW